MDILEWAARHGVSAAALAELADVPVAEPKPEKLGKAEREVQARVLLEGARKGVYLFRNNVGAGYMSNGQFIRWGLCNESTRLNAHCKSGDLIGIRKRLIVPADVGTHIGQFVSRECKPDGWQFNPNDRHEAAQLRWKVLIQTQGGDAQMVNGTGSL